MYIISFEIIGLLELHKFQTFDSFLVFFFFFCNSGDGWASIAGYMGQFRLKPDSLIVAKTKFRLKT